MNRPTTIIAAILAAAALSASARAADPAPDAAARAAARRAATQDAEPAVAASDARKPARPRTKPVGTSAGEGKAMDRLELERTQITGNRELPKVMVVVPWKRADIGELVGRPVNSLVDEVLQPVDREVFRREVDYYGALSPDRARAETQVTSPRPESRPEK